MGNIKETYKKLGDYKPVLLFIVSLLGANFIWKLLIEGSDHNNIVFFLGHDATQFFNIFSSNTSEYVALIFNLFGVTYDRIGDIVFAFENGNRAMVHWSCTPIKQLFIFFVIMIFAEGKWLKKLWYIPIGVFLIYVFNVIRVALLIFVVKYNREYFDIMHTFVLKYVFYLFLFLIWVYWQEKVVTKGKKTHTAGEE